MQRHWTLDDIDWSRFDAAKVSPEVLKVIKTAAMVERNGADYGRYLCSVFRDDAQFCDAVGHWAAEEEQHGLALGRWAAMADPGFDLDRSFGQRLGEIDPAYFGATGRRQWRDGDVEDVLHRLSPLHAAI